MVFVSSHEKTKKIYGSRNFKSKIKLFQSFYFTINCHKILLNSITKKPSNNVSIKDIMVFTLGWTLRNKSLTVFERFSTRKIAGRLLLDFVFVCNIFWLEFWGLVCLNVASILMIFGGNLEWIRVNFYL
jgi:hypothetical protein